MIRPSCSWGANPGPHCQGEHDDWLHAPDWDAAESALDAGYIIYDTDSDLVVSLLLHHAATGPTIAGYNYISSRNGQNNRCDNTDAQAILLPQEVFMPDVSEEEVAAAVQSIQAVTLPLGGTEEARERHEAMKPTWSGLFGMDPDYDKRELHRDPWLMERIDKALDAIRHAEKEGLETALDLIAFAEDVLKHYGN